MNRKSVIIGLAGILALAIFFSLSNSRPAMAAFPDKPISLLVPFQAGGGTDGTARALAARLEKVLNVPVVVKNEVGSGGRRGSIALFKSQPDGYTIGFVHFATLLYDDVFGEKKSPIDFTKFAAILKVDAAYFFIYVNKKSPFKTLGDLKNTTSPIKFGSTGIGTPSWLVPEAFRAELGFPITFVAGYKSLAEAALAVARGDVDAAVGTYTHIQGVLDDLRPLVYVSDQKAFKLPDVPTIVEAGYPRLAVLDVPWMIAAPPGTPEKELELLRAALSKIVNSEEFSTWAKDAGYSPVTEEPADFWKKMQMKKEIYENLKSRMQAK
ncbi:MAG: tripartite tricarboxylate transporter substrate binding protein [Proteobacteria bacterium]|nr:tripartite tricarboxylate transporter substrate binding protein [Pseudomonadota bacterium]